MKDKIIRELVKALEAFIEEFESQEEVSDHLTAMGRNAIAQAKRYLDPLEGLPLANVPVIPAGEAITATAQAMAERRRFSFEDLPVGTVVTARTWTGHWRVMDHSGPDLVLARRQIAGEPRDHWIPLNWITAIISVPNPIIENTMANRDPDDIPF